MRTLLISDHHLNGGGESDAVVIVVKCRVVFAYENVTQNPQRIE